MFDKLTSRHGAATNIPQLLSSVLYYVTNFQIGRTNSILKHKLVLLPFVFEHTGILGQLEKQGTGNGTGTGTGTGNKNLHEASGAETTRNSRLSSSREPGTSRSMDSR